MKPLIVAFLLAMALPASAASTSAPIQSPFPGFDYNVPYAFNVRDLVMLKRVGDPQLSPDGRYAAYTIRRTDYVANKGVTSIYVLDLEGKAAPRKIVAIRVRVHFPSFERAGVVLLTVRIRLTGHAA